MFGGDERERPDWVLDVLRDSDEALRTFFDEEFDPETQLLVLGLLRERRAVGIPQAEMVKLFEKEVREFKESGFYRH